MLVSKILTYKLFIIYALYIFSSCTTTTGIVKEDVPLINYELNNSLSTVLDKAKKEGKIVFVDMYADWCLPCKVMDSEVFSDKPTADFLNENFINYKVDGERGEGPDLNVIYDVKGYPTQLFLDSKGRVIEKNLGALGIRDFNILAERALTKSKETN